MHIASKLILFVFLLIVVIIIVVYQANVEAETYPDEHSAHPLVPFYSDLMFLSGVLLVALILQVALNRYEVQIPFHGFVILFGLLWGIVIHYDGVVRHAVHLVQMTPGELLYVFLPVTVFSISFCLDFQIFSKTLRQSAVIGIPVCLLTAFLFGVEMHYFLKLGSPVYGGLFGVICTPIFPKCVRYLLTQQSTRTKQLIVLLESEALFAMIIIDLTQNLLTGYLRGYVQRWYQFLLLFIRFTIFGIISGFFFGHLYRFLIRKVYTEKMSVFVIIFAAPFFTVAVSHKFLSGCATISVFVVGAMLGMERNIMPQDVDTFLTNFWEIIGYILDIVVIMITSMIASSQVTPYRNWADYARILATYCFYYVTRFFCFLIFFPVIKRLGYGMDIKNMLVCVWCGIKSPFSLFIITVFEDDSFSIEISEIFLYYVLGLNILTLFINGSLADVLLDFLGLKTISLPGQINMNNCIKHIFLKREITINILKMDMYLRDTNWPLVIEATNLTHPYHISLDANDNEIIDGYRILYCSRCKKEVPQELSPKEMKELSKEVRLRVLKAKKMSYSRQYENGMVSKQGIRILNQAVEFAMDSENATIEVEDLHRRFVDENWFHRLIKNQAERVRKNKAKRKFRKPRTYWRRICYHLVETNRTFDKIILGLIALNFFVLGLELYYHPSFYESPERPLHLVHFDRVIVVLEIIFALAFLLEFVIRVLAYSYISVWSHGCRTYFRSIWNIMDFIALLGSFGDVLYDLIDFIEGTDLNIWEGLLYGLRSLRAFRLVRVFEIFYPDLVHYLNKSLDEQMAFTYELGKSYVSGEIEILNMLPQMIDNAKIRHEVKNKIEADRILITRLLSVVQKDRPWIAITVKTKQAIWTIMSSMNEALNYLKTSGWIDTIEYKKLEVGMAVLQKKVNSIKKVDLSPPKVIFKEVAWMAEDEEVIEFLFQNVSIRNFDAGDVVFAEGEVADGIYVVVAGLLMLTYKPNQQVIANLENLGQLPIVDYLPGTKYEEPYVDYIVSGNCVGELSTLTQRSYNCIITTETHSQVYVLSQSVLKQAMELSPDPVIGLECRIWREASIRVAVPILLATPAYHTLSQDQVKYALERAFVPDLKRFKTFALSEIIEDIVLIEGVATDSSTQDVFVAPCCIPRTVQKLILSTNDHDIRTKLLIIPAKNIDEYDVMLDAEDTCEFVETESSTKCLQHRAQERARRRRLRQRRDMQSKPFNRGLGAQSGLSLATSIMSTKTVSGVSSFYNPSQASASSSNVRSYAYSNDYEDDERPVQLQKSVSYQQVTSETAIQLRKTKVSNKRRNLSKAFSLASVLKKTRSAVAPESDQDPTELVHYSVSQQMLKEPRERKHS